MANFDQEYDVAVIDEVQMISNISRGHSWLNAILGVKAKQIHICGDESALNILTKILSKTGDKLTVY